MQCRLHEAHALCYLHKINIVSMFHHLTELCKSIAESPRCAWVQFCSSGRNRKQEMARSHQCQSMWIGGHSWGNSWRPRQNRRHFADNVFKCNFLNENVWIPIKISLKFVPKGPINNIPALVQIVAWRRTGNKPLSEPMMAQFNDTYMRHSASMS